MALVGDDVEFNDLENQHKICCALNEDEKTCEKEIYGDDKI